MSLLQKMEELDAAMTGLAGQIATLESRLRAGDKGAYRACKFQRLQLAKLRAERSELEKKLRRAGAHRHGA